MNIVIAIRLYWIFMRSHEYRALNYLHVLN